MKPSQPERRPAAVGADDADRQAALALVPVSRETEARLALYVERLRRWQAIKNLVGPATLHEVWTRHIADSAQLVDLVPHARRWVDLGSGAGFPGVVVALLLHGQHEARVDLIESNDRKCAFLREIVRMTGAPATVHAGRIEHVIARLGGGVDVVTSRALAALPLLVRMSERLLAQGAVGLFLAGDDPPDIEAIGPGYRIDSVASRTHHRGRIVIVRRADLWESEQAIATRDGRNGE